MIRSSGGAWEQFAGRTIEIINLDDAGEHMIEFRDPDRYGTDSITAVSIPHGGTSTDAVVSINPNIADIPVGFMLWAINKAQSMT